MNKQDLYTAVNSYAPYETAESWDCSGWIVDNSTNNVNRVMLCLTVTDDIVEQAVKNGCDMIISHHPLFYVPIKYKNINILCAHTNLDKAEGGTTDKLIEILGLPKGEHVSEFLRICEFKTTVKDLANILCKISENLRLVNNKNINEIHKIAFCAGSGSEFINEAKENGSDAIVTGDVKFHTALESEIVIFDIGHFESEIPVLKVFEELINDKIEVIYAKENSPFIQIKS